MQLANFIKEIKTKREKKNPATKVFQALRIEVNSEIDNLQKCLISLKNLLKKGGKVVVISFHSIEDRLVKKTFRKLKDEKKVRLLTKKPLTPLTIELNQNNRSRSAKLRALESIAQL